MRARLAAYAGTQFRDFLAGRALLLVAATAIAAWGYAWSTGVEWAVFDPAGGVAARDQLRHLFEGLLLAFAFAGGVLAAGGLVARDRARGFDRVLFARPMSPVRYYAQAFVVSGAGTVALAGVAAELFAVAVQPVSVGGVMAYVALAWLAIGGLGFALAVATRLHAGILLLLIAADLLLHAQSAWVGALPGGTAVAGAVRYLLPPAHVVADLREPFARGTLVDPWVLTWPLAFGAACIAIGLVVLRRRPFGS